MAKKSEATAKFKNLDNVIQNWEKSIKEGLINPLFNVKLSVDSDIKAAGGYENKETKSKTMKFKKALNDYVDMLNKILNSFLEKAEEEELTIQDKIKKKYSSVDFNENGEILSDDPDQKKAASSEYSKLVDEAYIKETNKAMVPLKSTFGSLKKVFGDFNNDLKKQNKPARRRLGHISKFCNDDAIGTLEKIPKFLDDYEKAIIDYFKTLPDD